MTYTITTILGQSFCCECIGCDLAAGRIIPPGGMIAETEHFILHQDPEVPIRAFFIVASKAHIQSMDQMSAAEAQECFELVYRARKLQSQLGDISEVLVIQEERSEHFHLWLLPRYAWMDERFANSLTTVREMLKYAREHRRSEDEIAEILGTVKRSRELWTLA